MVPSCHWQKKLARELREGKWRRAAVSSLLARPLAPLLCHPKAPGPTPPPLSSGIFGCWSSEGLPNSSGRGDTLYNPPLFPPLSPSLLSPPPPSLSFLSYDFVRCSPKVEYRQSSLSVAMHKLKPFVTGVFLLPSQGREGPSFVARRRWIIN